METQQKSRINTRLLRKVVKHIIAEPQRYDQNQILVEPEDYFFDSLRKPACGTIGCIAGWAALLGTGKNKLTPREHAQQKQSTIYNRGRKLLGLSSGQFERLCGSSDNWPDEFSSAYIDGPRSLRDLRHNAKVLKRRVEAFIKSNGKV